MTKTAAIQQSFFTDDDIQLPYHEEFRINGRKYVLKLDVGNERWKAFFDCASPDSGCGGPVRHGESLTAVITQCKEWAIGDEKYHRLGRYTE